MRARSTATLLLVASATSPALAQDLQIVECSLGCASGSGGQITCSTVDIRENEQIDVVFDRPVDPASVAAAAFQIVDVANGAVPPGQLVAHPEDPRRSSFRPELIGTGTGAVAFGFGRNRAYQIRIPGTAQGDAGPFLTGTDGTPNTNRLLCTVFTSLGVGPGFTRECVATVNSTGLPARIDATGTTSRLANDLTPEGSGLPALGVGAFVVGSEPALARIGTCARCGDFGPSALVGTTWYAQYVFRDRLPTGAAGVGTSDALRFTVHP